MNELEQIQHPMLKYRQSNVLRNNFNTNSQPQYRNEQ